MEKKVYDISRKNISINKKKNQNEEILAERINSLKSGTNLRNQFICILDNEQNIVYANKILLEELNYSENEILSKKFYQLLDSPNGSNEKEEIINYAINNLWSGKINICSKDGSLIETHLKISSIKNNNGEVCGFDCVAEKIYGLSKFESILFDILKKSKNNFRKTPDIFIKINYRGSILEFISFDMMENFNRDEKDYGDNIKNFFPGNVAAQFFTIIKKVIDTNKPSSIEFRLKPGDKEISFEALFSLYSEKQIMISIKENTPDREGDPEINKFKIAVESSGEIIFFTDKKGIITYINPAFTKMYGFEQDEVVGKKVPRIIKSKLAEDEFYTEYRDTFLSKSRIKNEIVNKLKDGKEIFIEDTVDPIIDYKGEIIGFLAIQRNITESKKTEEFLRDSEKLVTIGKMSAYLAHEIKNPLASIKNFTELLYESDEFPENIKRTLNLVRDEVKRLNKLVKDVLEFSRPINPIFIQVELKSLIEKVKEFLPLIINGNNIQLINNLDNIKITGDYLKLQSLFLNIIENSIDAVSGNGIIEIWADKNEETYSIYIKDNGTGVVQKERIFEPFFSTKSNGTGLGLSIVKKILELHKGEIILVSSKPGETIFKLNFPVNFAYGKNSNYRR